MPTDGWYEDWVGMHCDATGADNAVTRALLTDTVRGILLDGGKTTPEELGAVTVRLIARHETPRFPNQHTDAVGLELVRLREERRAASLPPPAAAGGDFAPDCPACGGSGLAVVPHPRCIWERRLVLHPEQGRVVTVAVLCDVDGCTAGEVARQKERQRLDDKPRRPTLSAFERVHDVAAVAVLRAHEREEAERVRRATGGGGNFPAMDAILKRARDAA